jgi:large subunit ribosomal protein L22
MGKLGYSSKTDPEMTAKAIGRELHISPKASVEICREIRGMMVEDAAQYLEDVKLLKRPVRYRRYIKQIGHRKGEKFGPGRYPIKAADAILDVIRNAQHNAEYKGLDSENMKITHISTHRGMTTQGYQPRAYGRSTPFNHETANIEVVLEVVGE